jgi:competence ComEA-like helix-hairpin-helix protein
MISTFLTNSAPVYRRILIFLLCLPLILAATSCAKRSRATVPNAPPTPPENYTSASLTTQRININDAPARELEVLPGIGKGLAERSVEHREKYGPFRRAEHLMMVRGIGETRFRTLRDSITIE